jgi:hypothetical protein
VSYSQIISVRTAVAAALAAAALLLCASAPARAEFGFSQFDTTFTNADGTPATQAGSHPFAVTTVFKLKHGGSDAGGFTLDNLKDADFQQIAGLVGDATAVPRCTTNDFSSHAVGDAWGTYCRDETVVGYVKLDANFPDDSASYGPVTLPVFALDPAPGAAAAIGFNAVGELVTINLGVKTSPGYNVVASLRKTAQPMKVFGSALTLWGVPADPAHDGQRATCLNAGGLCPSKAPPRPFITLPRACAGPLSTDYVAYGWGDPTPSDAGSVLTHDNATPANPIGISGCNKLGFGPTITAKPTTTAASSALGVDFSLDVADEGLTSPTGLAQSDIAKTVVTLPAGVTINPSVAAGLAACGQADLARETIDSAPGAGCPEASKIGTVDVETPLLAGALPGSLYVAQQGDNPFGTLLAFYVVVKDPSTGILIKLAAKVDPDPVTGQLTATVDDIPQLPFAHFNLHFRAGARAPLTSPPACGSYTTTATLTPTAGGASATPTSTADVTSGPGGGACPAVGANRPFGPSMTAGVTTPEAGASSPFVLDITRPDGDQAIQRLDVAMPPGLLAKLAGVPQCSDAALAAISTAVGSGRGEIAAPSCPAASRLGQATVRTGTGPEPYEVSTGKVYFAGPYKGAPFSLAVVAPAVAGPFDLGTVVVRAALAVDPIDAHVTVHADPLPTILAGIPLQIREIRTVIDRPGFMLSPTSCDPTGVSATVTSDLGVAAGVASRFQVGGCSALNVAPRLALALSGKGQTTDGKHPAVSAVLSQSAGQANLKKVRVALPLSLALDPDNANGLCEFTDGSKVEPTCPKASIVGTATAVTPILDQPLSGPVYFVKNIRKDPKSGREIRTLPKLVIPLVGQNGLKLTLTGTSAVEDDQLVTTFDNIPDAPVSSFKLNINGGKGGILVVSDADICKSTQVADQQVDGQNGKTVKANVFIQTPSCPLKVLSKTVSAKSVTLKVGGLGAGRITVSGRGIRKTTKTITKSTVATVTAKRTRGKPGKVTVSFDPTGPAKAHKITK